MRTGLLDAVANSAPVVADKTGCCIERMRNPNGDVVAEMAVARLRMRLRKAFSGITYAEVRKALLNLRIQRRAS